LLADVLGSAQAVRLHQHFKQRVIARLGDRWKLTADEIVRHVWMLESEVREPAAADDSSDAEVV
jgi:hypothetical protein